MGESVFISHNHLDKPIARRLARRLGAYHIAVWLDERELRLGTELSPTIQEHIAKATTMVVVASESAAASGWVQKEIAFAKTAQPPISICPFFVEDVKAHPTFKDYLGLDATDPHEFERRTQKLAEEIAGAPLPPVAAERLRDDLRALSNEVPAIRLLVETFLEGEGKLLHQLAESVAEVPFHPLDFAINALYDIAEAEQKINVVRLATHYFAKKGVGKYALEEFLASRRESGSALDQAVGTKLANEEFDAALDLLSRCSPPDDRALAGFLDKNGSALNAGQRNCAVRLITFPVRGPGDFAADAAFEGLRVMPEREDLYHLWRHWIITGQFDEGDNYATLARYLGKAVAEKLPGWEPIVQEFLSHVKQLVESKDRSKVEAAAEHLREAVEQKSPLARQIATRCESAARNHGPEADKFSIYVESLVDAAHGNKDWPSVFLENLEHWKALRKVHEMSNDPSAKSTEA